MQDQQGQDAMGVGSMIREVQELAEKFKSEDDEHYVSPYAQLEKAKVLQEARYVIVIGYSCCCLFWCFYDFHVPNAGIQLRAFS